MIDFLSRCYIGTPSPSPPKRIYPKTPTHLLTPITPTSNNNRAKRKSQSSIASTIIKSAVQQVDADLIRKSPVRLSSFEVKKSDVINPYANLERTRQPIQRKVKEVLKSASSENHRQERKRKLEIHTGRNEVMMGGNEPTVVIPVQMDVEELLERTMPDVSILFFVSAFALSGIFWGLKWVSDFTCFVMMMLWTHEGISTRRRNRSRF